MIVRPEGRDGEKGWHRVAQFRFDEKLWVDLAEAEDPGKVWLVIKATTLDTRRLVAIDDLREALNLLDRRCS